MAGCDTNIQRLEIVLDGLGELAEESIFIGGACTQFYVQDPSLYEFRPTKDIDCIVKVYTYAQFSAYGDELRKRGFKNDTTQGAPMVRWIYKEIPVDVIPDQSSVVGYRNIEWFKEGRQYVEERKLPSGRVIRVLPLAYYLATKLESWGDRGGGDFYSSKDMEDIIGVIDGNDSLEELLKAPKKVREYVIGYFAILLRNADFKRSIAGHIGFDETASERARDVVEKIAEIVKLDRGL